MKNSITAGIDFGNQQSILSIPTEHGIDIILNESSNRKTPTLVGYQEGRRLAGEFAQQQQMMNISNTITQFKHLINLQYNPQMLEQINKEEFPFKLTTLSDSTLGILLDNGEVLAFEQIIGFYLKSLFEIIQKRNPQIQHIVLAVPSNWTEIQRQSILNSALIANVKIAELLDSATASAVSLVKIHGDRFSEEEGQNVLFIEIGDSSMSSTIAKVTKKSIEMKSNFTDNSINGQIFTEKLEKYLIEKVAEKYKIDPKTNKRATIRFKQACEKVKKILSSNPVVLFEVPSLMNDIDVSITVKRDEFNELIKSFIPKIKENIELTIQKAGISKEDISYVEIVGGSTRIPLIKESIKEILGKEAKMSLDLDECFAIGAGFIASKIDGNDIGIEFVNDHCCPYSIDVKVDQEKELLNIFKENESKLSSSNKILLPISQQKTFTFYCNQSEIGKLDIDANNQEETEVEVLVSIDSFGIIRVENVAFKNGKKCMFSYTSQKSLSEEEISKYSKIEEIQDKQDKMEIEIDNTKNELESLIFTTENELKTIKNEEFQKKLESVYNWFDEHEFERMSLNEYESKVAEIKSIKSELNKSHEYENKKTKLAEIKQNLSKSLQSVKSDTERNQMEESLSLQSEMSKLISLIDEKMKLDKEKLIQTDIDNLLKESLNIEEKVKKLSQIQIPKKNRNKRRRRQNRRTMNGQRFDPWSPFGRRNNFFGGFMGGPWSNDEYDYEYCYDDDSDCQVQKQQQERKRQEILQKQEQERKRQEMLQKQEQERKRQEMLQKQEQERKRQEMLQKQEQERKRQEMLQKQEQERKRQEMLQKQEQERKRQEILQKQEQERKRQEMLQKQEQERKRQEMLQKQEQERKRQEMLQKQEQERKRQEMLQKQEQERKRQEMLQKQEQERKRQEMLQKQEQERKRQEILQKQEQERKRQEMLQKQEQERKRQEMLQKQEQERKRQEMLQKQEQERKRQEMLQKQEQERKRQEMLQKQEQERKRQEMLQKQEQERKRQEILQKQEQERRKQEILQKQEQERKWQEMLIEQEKKRQFEKENRKRAQIEQERTRRSKANNYTNSDDDDFSYLNQIKKEAQIQLQLEEEERKQHEMQKRQEQEKMRQIEMENRRRAQIEQERINRAKEAEVYRRSRAMNDPWSSAMYSPYGRSINPQRQSVQPRQYQQQRRVMPGYGYTWGF